MKKALVTGASSGIGRDMTRYLVDLGYEVFAVARDIEKLEIWHNWERIYINDDLTLKDYLKFYDVRYMQLKILLKTRQSFIKFNHLDVEVI